MSNKKTPTYLDTFEKLKSVFILRYSRAKSVFRLRHSEHVFDTWRPKLEVLWMDRYSDHPNRFENKGLKMNRYSNQEFKNKGLNMSNENTKQQKDVGPDKEFRVERMKASLVCGNCLEVFDGHIYYLKMIKPEKGLAIWAVINPIGSHPAQCSTCKARIKHYEGAVEAREI